MFDGIESNAAHILFLDGGTLGFLPSQIDSHIIQLELKAAI
jgi:hypothetical protein